MYCSKHKLYILRVVFIFTFTTAGVFGVMYDGYLSNAEDDPEGAVPVIIKTVKGNCPVVGNNSTYPASPLPLQKTHRI